MTSYFADSWYFIALANPFDPHHAAALRLQQALRPRVVVTHDVIFIEVLNFFCEYGPGNRDRAVRTVRGAALQMTVQPADRDLFRRALDFYERRRDKEYSLTDCMSMLVMRDRGIEHVLTNDHHFAQERFTVLSDAP